MRKAIWVGGLLGVLGLGCSEPTAQAPESGLRGAGDQPADLSGVSELVTGSGQFVHPVFGSVTFAFEAVRHGDGRVSGTFFQDQPSLGFTYEGAVTCFAVDQVNHRAWIGGVVTSSNDPDPVTEVGDDVWFRVLDAGKHSADPDRSTFFGFEQPPPGIVTSEEYCQLKIWPDGNARAWPVERGNIVLH